MRDQLIAEAEQVLRLLGIQVTDRTRLAAIVAVGELRAISCVRAAWTHGGRTCDARVCHVQTT